VGSNGFGTRTFWTTAIPDSDVTVQFAAGRAEMRVDNMAIEDYHFLANAIGPNFDNEAFNDAAMVSFDVVWSSPITRRVSVTDGTLGNNYAGNYVENQVTVSWSGTNLATGFSFTANPGTFATSFFDGGFAELGHESNGIFFPTGGDAGSAIATGPQSSTTLGKPAAPSFVIPSTNLTAVVHNSVSSSIELTGIIPHRGWTDLGSSLLGDGLVADLIAQNIVGSLTGP
jgi:hypothetical protein